MAKKVKTEVAEAQDVAEVKENKKTAKKVVKEEVEVKAEEAEAQEVKNPTATKSGETAEGKKSARKTAKAEVKTEDESKDGKKPAKPKADAAEVVETKVEMPADQETTHEAVAETVDPVEVSVEQKLVALYTLQQVDSKIDEIRAYRGNLPLEIQDMEDEIAGLQTRISNFKAESKKYQTEIANHKIKIKEIAALIKKYEDQQNNVRNNREYDSLTKEIEYQTLDSQLSEKRIRENQAKEDEMATRISESENRLKELSTSLKDKKEELHSLVEGTEKEESQLQERSAECEKFVEDRLLVAYKRIRKNARNGLAVVGIFDEACGGCFNRIPPQHQLDICTHKKIIVCEYCGRILVDKGIIEQYKS